MLVVVSIIGLLLAIAIPAVQGVVNSQKRQATLSTMQTLEGAISAFASEKPIHEPTYLQRYGPYPPSPVSPIVLSTTSSGFTTGQGPSGFDKTGPYFTGATGTKAKFELLVTTYLVPEGPNIGWHYNGNASWITTDAPKDTYLSIETLVLFLEQLSPQARRVLERMEKNRTNLDSDDIAWDSDGNTATSNLAQTNLWEITDAWGTPLRYAVQTPVVTPGGVLQRRWELRSAGPDGKFGETFDPLRADGSFVDEDKVGDDVILRGP